MDGRRRRAASVEVQREEADREVQGFPWDFVPVDERAPVSVDRNQPERAGRAAKIPPIGGGSGGGGGGGEMAIWREIGGRGGLGGSGVPGGCFGAAAAGSGAFFDAGVGGRLGFFGDGIRGLVPFGRRGAGDGREIAISAFRWVRG